MRRMAAASSVAHDQAAQSIFGALLHHETHYIDNCACHPSVRRPSPAARKNLNAYTCASRADSRARAHLGPAVTARAAAYPGSRWPPDSGSRATDAERPARGTRHPTWL